MNARTPGGEERNGREPAECGSAALDQEALELAALYALAALSGPEMETVERERAGQAAFWEEVRSLREAAAGLAAAVPHAQPSHDLWPEIRARLAGARPAPVRPPVQVWRRWPADLSDARVVAADAHAFEPTEIAGISVRRLFVDEPGDRVTMLVRMQPGTAYPAHRHAGPEECYVLEGDLEIAPAVSERLGAEHGTLELHAGDYQRMDRDSEHGVQSTRGGCLLLISGSRHDELAP